MDFIRAMAAGNFNYMVPFPESGVTEEGIKHNVPHSPPAGSGAARCLKAASLAKIHKLPAGVTGASRRPARPSARPAARRLLE